jgi:hypothetical protein
VEIRFILPTLRRLDVAGTEVLVAGLAEGERPPRGVAGLLDWRMAGRLSALICGGFATGAMGEVLLLTGKPRLPFEKVLLFGTGPIDAFGDRAYRCVVESVLTRLEGLHARSAVVELPGRHFGGISAELATDILLELAADRPDHDLWTLIESPDAQRVITEHMIRERRRVRR